MAVLYGMGQEADIFDAAFLRKLEALDAALLKLRGRLGEGIARGGRSLGQTEFRGHRPYSAGDDLRRLDWNAYGRLGRLFMREFEQERQEHLTLVLDRSRSMAAGDPPKHLLSRRLAAAAGYIALKRGGDVTLAGNPPVEGLSRFNRLLDQLRAAGPDADGGLGFELSRLPGRRSGGDLLVIGDGLEPVESLRPLAAIGGKGRRIGLLLVLAPDELEPPLGGFEIEGLEERETLELNIGQTEAEDYRRELEVHLESIESLAIAHGWSFDLCESSSDILALFVGGGLAATRGRA